MTQQLGEDGAGGGSEIAELRGVVAALNERVRELVNARRLARTAGGGRRGGRGADAWWGRQLRCARSGG